MLGRPPDTKVLGAAYLAGAVHTDNNNSYSFIIKCREGKADILFSFTKHTFI